MSAFTDDLLRAALPAYLAEVLRAGGVDLRGARRLSGGAIQENWLLQLEVHGGEQDGPLDLVLRTDAPSGVATSRTRADEFAIIQAAWSAGVLVPRPFACEPAGDLLGRPFFLASAVRGTALGQRITRNPEVDRSALVGALAEQLAKIHACEVGRDLGKILGPAPDDVIGDLIRGYCEDLDAVTRPAPIVELALRRLEDTRPAPTPPVLCHRDFRTGNYMVEGSTLTGILDWEFAGWSDRYEDLGWFCSKRWRFAPDDRPAGGLATRQDFFDAYSAASGFAVDGTTAAWWELMANVRWAVIAHQQADRHLVGGERSLDLALIGRRIHETEREIVSLLLDFGEIAA